MHTSVYNLSFAQFRAQVRIKVIPSLRTVACYNIVFGILGRSTKKKGKIK